MHSIEFKYYVTLRPLFYNASILSLNYITNLFIKGCTWVLMVRFDSVSERLVMILIIILIITKHNDIINKR
jgi:hypothetical protein